MSDYAEVHQFILRLERRISALEEDSAFIEKNIQFLDNSNKNTYAKLHEDILVTRETLQSITSTLKNNTLHMMLLSKNINTIVKKEQVERISEAINSIPFNEFITPRDIKS